MPLKEQTTLRVVLYEGDGAQPLEAGDRFTTMTTLLEKGFAVTRVSDKGRVAPADRTSLLVLGRFNDGRAPLGEDASGLVNLRFQDITDFDSNRIAEAVETLRAETNAAKHGDWKPWFPVIDYDRCTNCMQCLSFCLFGVYGVDEQQRIQVQNNDNCKTNCPACSRVCPEAAIMFPKYKAGPINGDVVSDADLQREKMKIDISALLGGDVYAMLRERSEKAKSRFSKERDADKALQERQKCLVKLASAGDIPPEVLMSLPSPEEIARRAEEAKAKAQTVLAAQQRGASTA
ncbi:MAG: Fe-S cluster protein [Verrucomicrobia bacterium]|nr:MAG: Fe-S cluster protein [Verrucomicrobiota bacterium]PYJ96852.1 MAG: Fe-S cluster protein [Verrucomicrobiota bacterium]